MNGKIDKSWHLAQSDQEIKVSEFEFLLWRVFYGFLRWQEACNASISEYDLTGYELAVLHIIRMKDRPKTAYEIGRLLNREDIPNIQYSIRKLLSLGLIEKAKSSNKKGVAFQTTKAGIKNTDVYREARKNMFIGMLKDFGESELNLETATKTLSTLKGIYDEASRIVASYKDNK